jgi:hypothetical protein
MICCALSAKTNAFLFYNANFFKVFPFEKENYSSMKKRLSSEFKIVEIKYFLFDSLPNEINKLTSRYNDGLIVLDDFLSPYILKNANTQIGKFKLLTYNLPQTANINLPVFNVIIDNRMLKDEFLFYARKYSKNKDFSDCGLIIDPNDPLSNEIVNMLQSEGNKFIVNIVPENSLNWITSNRNLKVLILFSGKGNSMIDKIENHDIQKINFIEVFTDYGKNDGFVKHRITIDWKKAFDMAIGSKEFSAFIKQPGSPVLKNYPVKGNVLIDKK